MSATKKRSYKIAGVTKDKERFIADIRLIEGGKEVGRLSHAYPATLSEKEIERDVKKVADTFFSDKDQQVVEKVKAEEDKVAQKKIEKLAGIGGSI